MERRKAIVTAATIAGSLLAASTAYALTSGVVDGGSGDGAGELSPVVEVPATVPPSSPGSSVAVGSPDDHGEVTGRAGSEDGDRFDDDALEGEGEDHDDALEDEGEGEGDDEHEVAEPFEYEGRDDDD